VHARDLDVSQGKDYLARNACVSKRRFPIRLFIPPGETVRSVKVLVHGRRAPVEVGRGFTVLVDLRGLRKGRFTVRIYVVLGDGTRLRGLRSYHTCEGKNPGKAPPGPL
jgi:hypothetical protein